MVSPSTLPATALYLFASDTFSVAFVIAAHDHTASLLADEGDRAARAGADIVARAERLLARGEAK